MRGPARGRRAAAGALPPRGLPSRAYRLLRLPTCPPALPVAVGPSLPTVARLSMRAVKAFRCGSRSTPVPCFESRAADA